MIATINKPTRVTSYTATAIDNIITNSIFDNDFESAIIKTDVPDHFPIIFTIKLKTTSCPKNHVDQFIYKRDLNENSFNLFNPYSPNVTLLYPLKTTENQKFSYVFRGYRNVTLGEYGLSKSYLKHLGTV